MPVSTDFFQVGGTLSADAPSYIPRPADEQLVAALKAREFCLVLAPRQTGKSSLMVHAIADLEQNGIKSAVVDLQPLGSETDFGQWFVNVIYQIKRFLKLKTDTAEWWSDHSGLGPSQRFITFLEDVVLKEIHQGDVVIFLDEIDSVLALPFADDLFTTIRAIYNARATNADLKRLSFVLLGVANPSSFIKNRSRTPFNIGKSITLEDFKKDSIESFQPVLGPNSKELIERMFYWTNGQPLLVQKLAAAAYSWPEHDRTPQRLDEEVAQTLLHCRIEQDTHFKFIQDLLLDESGDRVLLLATYKRVVDGKHVVSDDRSPIQQRLKLAGVVRVDDGQLVPRNRIYQGIFDAQWVGQHTPFRALRWFAIGVSLLLVLANVWFLIIQPRLIPQFPEFSHIYTSNPTVDLLLPESKLRRAYLNSREVAVGPRITLTDLPVGESKHVLKLEGWLPWHAREITVDVTYYPRWQVRQFPDTRLNSLNRVAQVEENRIIVRDISNGEVLRRYAGHNQDLVKVAWSADRKRLLSISRDRIGIWDVDSERLVNPLVDQGSGFVDAAWTPDARNIAIAGSDGSLKVAETEGDGTLRPFSPPKPDVATSIDISPDGRSIAEGLQSGKLKIWDTVTKQEIATSDAMAAPISKVVFSPFANVVAAADKAGTLRKWERQDDNLRLSHTFDLKSAVDCLTFSPDGKRVVVVSGVDVTLVTFGDNDRSSTVTFSKFLPDKPIEVSFSPDGQVVYAISPTGTVKVWGADRFDALDPFVGHPNAVERVEVSADGKILSITETKESKVWEAVTGQELLTVNSTKCELVPANRAVLCLQQGKVDLWNIDTRQVMRQFAARRPIDAFAVTPNGKTIVTEDVGSSVWDYVFFDVLTGQRQIKLFNIDEIRVGWMDGSTIQLQKDNGLLEIWDVETRRLISSWAPGHPDLSNALDAFSKDHQKLALTDNRNRIQVWEVNSGRLIQTIVPNDGVDVIDFSPDGNTIIAISQSTATFFNANTGERIGPAINANTKIEAVYDFSPDGTMIVVPNFSNELALYEIQTGRLLRTFSGHNGPINSVRFLPDGKTMVSASSDKTLKLWWTVIEK